MTSWPVVAATLFAYALALDSCNPSASSSSWGAPPPGYVQVKETTYKLVPDPANYEPENVPKPVTQTRSQRFDQASINTHRPINEYWQCSNCRIWNRVCDTKIWQSDHSTLSNDLQTDFVPSHSMRFFCPPGFVPERPLASDAFASEAYHQTPDGTLFSEPDFEPAGRPVQCRPSPAPLYPQHGFVDGPMNDIKFSQPASVKTELHGTAFAAKPSEGISNKNVRKKGTLAKFLKMLGSQRNKSHGK